MAEQQFWEADVLADSDWWNNDPEPSAADPSGPSAATEQFTGARTDPSQPLTAPYGEYQLRVPKEFQPTPIRTPGMLETLTTGLPLRPFSIGQQLEAIAKGQDFGGGVKSEGIPALRVPAGIVKGGENVATGAMQFMTSPAGIATLGLSAAPAVVRSLASAGFAADMASHAPDAYQKFEEARLAGDDMGQAEALTEGLGTLAMAGLAGSHSYATAREVILNNRAKPTSPEPSVPLETAPAVTERPAAPVPEPEPVATRPPVTFETPGTATQREAREARKAAEPAETAPTAPQQAPAGIPEQPVKAAEAVLESKLTPMQRQYRALKEQHPDELVLIRIGDFYEAFWKDAETFSKDAGVSLTKRQDVPMAGVPYHSVGKYIQQLENKGHKVHVVEDLREVTQSPTAVLAEEAQGNRPVGGAEQARPVSSQVEPAISFPGIGSLREKQATAMELGKIRKSEPELWKAITAYFSETAPSKISKAARAAFQRQREAESRAASAGPGAASPVEFEQRARVEAERAARGDKPPGDNPPVTTDASAGPNIERTRANRDYNILNRVNSGQFTFSFGKLGQAAKAAWERMALGEFRMRESIGRDVKRYVTDLLDSLPREFRKKGGKAFFEILDGKKLEQIADEWSMRDGGPEVIRAATELKTRLEEIRTTIRDTNRDAYNAYLMSLDRPILEDLFRKNINAEVDISRYPNEGLAEALSKDAYRDDWGIADGSYLPHIFFGNWKVTVTDAVGNSRFITRSKTPHEAEAEIYKFVKRNPELADANFKVEQDTVVPADMIRLGDRRFWKLVGEMKEKTGLSEAEVRQAQQGIIGKKSSKKKWWGNLQKREGYEGYSQDFQQVMGAYLNGFHRWVELSQMQRDVQPLIERVRREGRGRAAERLDEIMENLWGKPARTTIEFDNLIRRIPGLRDYVKPLALERWSRNVRSIVALLTLKTPRFAVVNRLQPLQGLYPLVGERIMAQAKFRQHTKEGRELLDRAGVTFDPGQYREGAGGKAMTLSERFSGERTNQEWAFLAMYQHGIERGLSPPEAMKYAKLRGQLFTQFTPLIADTPQIMQGPLTGLLFQFKRFPIKQAELLTRLVQEKRIGGIARWLGVMALAGGASYFLRQFYADAEKKKRLRDSIAEEHGEQVADGIMYGLPGLIGADLSGSLVLGDEPFGQNIYEKTGRAVVGPAVGIAVDTARQLATDKREPTTTRQDAVTLLRRFPTLRPLGELLALEDSDLDVRTPDGEVRYRKALKDALLGMGSFRSANESNIKLAIDSMIELKKEIAGLKNRYFVESEQGDSSKAEAAIEKFNERWPELEIGPTELLKYSELRRKGLDKTDVERISGKKLKSLVP